MTFFDNATLGLTVIIFLALLAFRLGRTQQLGNIAFTVWVMVAVVWALFFPETLQSWGSFSLKSLIIPLLMIIMFGMGAAMSLDDFTGILKMPKGVLIGLACQFTIMPLIGFSLTEAFNFPPEIAAGIILVGSSPSGLASNVMSYIAGANLALSLTLTAIATLVAPLLTPVLMKLLAGQLVPIDFWAMVFSMFKIVILPVGLGLLFNNYLSGKFPWLDRSMPKLSMIGIAVIIAIITAAGRDSLLAIGPLLIVACALHNGLGYLMGYQAAKWSGMDKASCRTIALEVGMQNSGLASGIALEMGKVATMGLAAVVFGPLMNISGSSLASYWKGKQ